jgi:hypothetical protein
VYIEEFAECASPGKGEKMHFLSWFGARGGRALAQLPRPPPNAIFTIRRRADAQAQYLSIA